MTLHGYPDMFFLYGLGGAQDPTAFRNGPSCVEVQGIWIMDAIAKICGAKGLVRVEATRETEESGGARWRR